MGRPGESQQVPRDFPFHNLPGTRDIAWNAEHQLAICRPCGAIVNALQLEVHFCGRGPHSFERRSDIMLEISNEWADYMQTHDLRPAIRTVRDSKSWTAPEYGSEPIEGMPIFCGHRCYFAVDRDEKALHTLYDPTAIPSQRRCTQISFSQTSIVLHCQRAHGWVAEGHRNPPECTPERPYEKVAAQRMCGENKYWKDVMTWVVNAPIPGSGRYSEG